MHQNNFTIKGRIVDPITNEGIPGLRLEVWDRDMFFDDFVGSAETDASGDFTITFNVDYF